MLDIEFSENCYQRLSIHSVNLLNSFKNQYFFSDLFKYIIFRFICLSAFYCCWWECCFLLTDRRYTIDSRYENLFVGTDAWAREFFNRPSDISVQLFSNQCVTSLGQVCLRFIGPVRINGVKHGKRRISTLQNINPWKFPKHRWFFWPFPYPKPVGRRRIIFTL